MDLYFQLTLSPPADDRRKSAPEVVEKDFREKEEDFRDSLRKIIIHVTSLLTYYSIRLFEHSIRMQRHFLGLLSLFLNMVIFTRLSRYRSQKQVLKSWAHKMLFKRVERENKLY